MEAQSCAPGALDASDAATRLERTTVKTEDETCCANAWEFVNKLRLIALIVLAFN